MTGRWRAVVATLCLVALLLALALPFSGGLAAAVLPGAVGLALSERVQAAPAPPEASPRTAHARPAAARGPPPIA